MAKKEKIEETELIPDIQTLEISDFVELPKTQVMDIPIKIGEVLIAELDKDGNETKTFTTNQKTVDRYFSDPSKFIIKKKG